MRVVFTGGGTGGHLCVARNVAEVLKATKEHELYYIGSTRGQDREWFEKSDLFARTYFLESTGIVNKNLLTLPNALAQQYKAMQEAIEILKDLRIQRVLSVGGYSAAPASFGALRLRLPLFVHEQNACMGLLNRLLKPFAREFYSSYLASSLVKDYPVGQQFFDTQRIRQEIKHILFLGGSQGAVAINNLALSLAPKLQERGMILLHQCGQKDYARVKESYQKAGIKNVELFAFVADLLPFIQRADFAISRAGASSLWELSANALPTLFIPYPYAAKNHQYHNAKFLLQQNLAYVLLEHEVTDQKVLEILSLPVVEKSQGLKNSIQAQGALAIAKRLVSD